ncbi:hypothetical protein DFJ74DRAFT_678661 [Hyaloraphidium curvatum]|nr:hypothetical protein DFJ74DRAFT_678661 [Hyaloraphidium curvatum]
MTTQTLSLRIFDGTDEDAVFTVHAPRLEDLAATREEALEILCRSVAAEARKRAKKCHVCRKGPLQGFATEFQYGSDGMELVVVATCGKEACNEGAGKALMRAAEKQLWRPAPDDSEVSVELFGAICSSCPADARNATIGDPVHLRTIAIRAGFLQNLKADPTPAQRIVKTYFDQLLPELLKSDPQTCLVCRTSTSQYVTVQTIDWREGSWTVRSVVFPSCEPCSSVVHKRGSSWQKWNGLEQDGKRIKATQVCNGCGACSTDKSNFQRCSRCKVASYCSRECQRDHWSEHKKICRPPADST